MSSRWLAKLRSMLRPEVALAVVALPLFLESCIPDTPPDEVRTIEGFVECLNNRILGGDIANAVQCLPCGCTLTLTNSRRSAQPACIEAGCQLPRVLVNCPGPPQFQPSFSLCTTDPDGGLDRVEIGQTINAQGHMRMADVHVGPGGYVYTDPSSVVSKAIDENTDSAGCWVCHEHDEFPAGEEAISKPEPYQIFGKGCVIDTDEPCQEPDAGNCNPQHHNEPVTKKTLEQVCQCITDATNDDENPLFTTEAFRARALCNALLSYQQTRGICGTTECPQNQGPDCSALATGVDCDPYIAGEGGTAADQPTGYTCQEVEPGVKQCVSSRECVAYSLEGGGKFLGEDGVSLLRLSISGKAAVDLDCPICDSNDIEEEISAFNHAANTVVNGVELSSVKVTDLGGGDFTAEGKGTASVGGSPANVGIDASKALGGVAFDIEDTDGPSPVAGGDGEPGRADFSLTETPSP